MSDGDRTHSAPAMQPRTVKNTPSMLIRRYLNVIEISPDGRQPTPVDVCDTLAAKMTYTHVRHLFGRDRIWVDPATGDREERLMAFDKRRLYKLDDHGRYVCGRGYLSWVTATLRGMGYRVFYRDLTPPANADCYVPQWARLLGHIEFRERQEEALLALASNECGVFDAAPGFGKTFVMAVAPLLYPTARFALVTRGLDRLTHLRREVSQFLPRVGQFGGGSRDKARVTLFSADSLKYFNDADFDFVLVDEVHEMAADKYADVMARRFCTTRNFGFSATVSGRTDGTDARIESLFGPTVFHISQQESEALGLVVPIEVRWLDVLISQNPAEGFVDTARMRAAVWRNDIRNQILATAARQHPDSQVLIIVQTVEHAVQLGQYLPEYSLCYGTLDATVCERYIRKGLLPDNYIPLSSRDRRQMQEAFARGDLRKVIATDVWSTGMSFPELSVLIRGDARSSAILASQIPGRVDRIANGKEIGIVYDCADQFDAGFRQKAKTRERHYRDRGWTQIKPERVGRQLAITADY